MPLVYSFTEEGSIIQIKKSITDCTILILILNIHLKTDGHSLFESLCIIHISKQ